MYRVSSAWWQCLAGTQRNQFAGLVVLLAVVANQHVDRFGPFHTGDAGRRITGDSSDWLHASQVDRHHDRFGMLPTDSSLLCPEVAGRVDAVGQLLAVARIGAEPVRWPRLARVGVGLWRDSPAGLGSAFVTPARLDGTPTRAIAVIRLAADRPVPRQSFCAMPRQATCSVRRTRRPIGPPPSNDSLLAQSAQP